MTSQTQMPSKTRAAFNTLWENCTAEQRGLREAWLPRRDGNAQAEYDQALVDRHHAGLPLSIDGKRRVRAILKTTVRA